MKINPKADPLVHFLHTQMVIEEITPTELARKSGVSRETLYQWFAGRPNHGPNLRFLRYALAVFEYDLKPTPLRKK